MTQNDKIATIVGLALNVIVITIAVVGVTTYIV